MEPSMFKLAVVLPCYRVEQQIATLIAALPPWATLIVAVDDASPDRTGAILDGLAAADPRLAVIHHPRNLGVGGAMISGFRHALAAGADFVVKLDGDGQMDPAFLPQLLRPLLEGRADFAKGNRFRHRADLRAMPGPRFIGNVALTFLTKLASGYWRLFDTQNGYLALRGAVLARLDLDRLERGYCFENSLLVELSLEDAPVVDVAIPAIYRNESSSLSIARSLLSFPPKLLRLFGRRILRKYLLDDVSPVAVYLLVAGALFLFSTLFGGYHWARSILEGVPATTGTVVLALLPFLMAFNLLLQAIDLDIRNTPAPRPPRRELALEEVPALFGASKPAAENPDGD